MTVKARRTTTSLACPPLCYPERSEGSQTLQSQRRLPIRGYLKLRLLSRRHLSRQYYVYILASISKVLYVGVTNDLTRRIWEHKEKLAPGFTSKYNVDLLVYYEVTQDVLSAIAREKQIKGYRREKKVALIEGMNPGWKDLYRDLTG